MRKPLIFGLFLSGFLFFLMVACEQEIPFPKPKAYFALHYKRPIYKRFENSFYSVPINENVQIKNETARSVEIYYPSLKASLFLNYTPMEIPVEALQQGMEQKLSEHQKKATAIIAYPYDNLETRNKGVLYEIKGNAASAAQFYITDTKNHFMSGALYFNIKPSYDSIYPAAQYIMNDLRDLMGQVQWKTQ